MPTSPSTQPTMTDGYWRVADDEDEDNLVNANDNGVSDEGMCYEQIRVSSLPVLVNRAIISTALSHA